MKYRLSCLLLCIGLAAQAQIPVQQPGQAAPSPRAAKRYEIDAKRLGVNLESEDALPRSREFLRIDSTYYVGWFYEGGYKFHHAADYLGFKNASVPLARALRLMERDFRKELRVRLDDLLGFIQGFPRKIDYSMASFLLYSCYSNMEETQQAFDLVDHVKRWNFQQDLYMDVYNNLGWLVHRNRFYTSRKYPFLKNSIDENEALANRYLDSGLRKISINSAANAKLFGPNNATSLRQQVYYYKAILYSYALKIDSAAYYYGLIRNMPGVANNYATFQLITGHFRDAEEGYKKAEKQDPGDKRLKEHVYYTSLVDIYKGEPYTGANRLRDVIQATGSTPGFGWYNIGLARTMYYGGLIGQSARYIDKAASFKELHIGTTLGQSHYDFSIQLNRLMCRDAEWEMQRFEHADWWYNPKIWPGLAQHSGEKYLQQFLLINQLAQNPERERVIYKLFSTESTVSWDEIWYLIRDYSTGFFLKKFTADVTADKRKNIAKYFRLMEARLLMERGDYRQANALLDQVLTDPNIDVAYERLFLARVWESKARCFKELHDESAMRRSMAMFYKAYPQLVPYCGMPMPMALHVLGAPDPAIVKRLKGCNVEWIDNPSVPQAYVQFQVRNGKTQIVYYVMQDGHQSVDRQLLLVRQPEQAAVSLAYRLFGIGEPARQDG